jgi:hypothetical protein
LTLLYPSAAAVELGFTILLPLQLQDFRAVRQLMLLLKSCLKQLGLSEVYIGGLGAWSLVNMVIAHIMVRRLSGMWLLWCCC